MPRKLHPSLIKRLTEGKYAKIMKHVNADSALSFEVRVKGQAMIYYKKGKILTLFQRAKPVILDNGYYRNKVTPTLDLDEPKVYFDTAKQLLDDFNKTRSEFDVQQKIALTNKYPENRYLVVDMEYQFEQGLIKERTTKKTRFDLVAVDSIENKILLIELKHGFGAVNGDSGAEDHSDKYEEHINHPHFKTALIEDVSTIINTKCELGIFSEKPVRMALNSKTEVQFAFAFSYEKPDHQKRFQRQFGGKYKVFYFDINRTDYKLK